MAAEQARSLLDENFAYFGYGYIKDPADLVPHVGLTFYSFRVMVLLGGYFILLFIVALIWSKKNKFADARWLQWASLWTIPLAYIAGQAGWIVAEVGRQPWLFRGHPADRRIRVQAGHFIGTDDLLRLPVSLYRPAYRGDRHYGEGDQERAFGELRIMN